MSRRPSNSSRQRAGDDDGPCETTTAVCLVDEQTLAPSLESLLASCGALQSVLRQHDNPDPSDPDPSDGCRQVADHDAELEACRTEVADCIQTRNEPYQTTKSPRRRESPDSVVSGTELPANIASLMNSLRHEFRTAIDELKSAQEAAATSQSAVLKTLTEIIFQSSSMRNVSGDGVEQKLAETEDRILNRINQLSGLANAGNTHRSETSTNAGSGTSTAVGKDLPRSWAEIRDQLMVDGGTDNAQFEPDLQKLDRMPEESASAEVAAAEQTCRLEIPLAVDAETLNDLELRTAFYEREAFILTLIGRLRHQHQMSSGHLPAEQLKSMAGHLPEDLTVQVLQTLQQLDDLARIGELELSLERARLSRQVSQLEHSRRLIEHNARQLGLTLAADGTLSNPQKPTVRGSESRRWLSKLGFGQ